MITAVQSSTLGVVEGLTEYLPVSSTGHLILAARAMGLDLQDPGVSGFLVAIQAGAILAVLTLYRGHVASALRGLRGDRAGMHLLALLFWGCMPALLAGAVFGSRIKQALFNPAAVASALALGGVAMVVLPRLLRGARAVPSGDEPLDPLDVTVRDALLIGTAQCLALIPGTSRSMVTILAGLGLGLSSRQAAEFSFLLAVPILSAATAKDILDEGPAMLDSAGPLVLGLGFFIAWVVAALSVKFLIRMLNHYGLAPFGVYRIVLAAVVLWIWRA